MEDQLNYSLNKLKDSLKLPDSHTCYFYCHPSAETRAKEIFEGERVVITPILYFAPATWFLSQQEITNFDFYI
jgi:hypothetical protein